tara:strand:+ start:2504 stop:3505 length:1002 start_codon:yes stop_codon:yes gene_type:complete
LIVTNFENLILKCKNIKKNNKTIGMISGSFDKLHAGHKHALSFSKNYSDHLVVLVNSNDSIKTYKGKNRPFEDITTRLNNLERFNNQFIIYEFDSLIPNKLIEAIKPDFYFLSEEWSRNPVEKSIIDRINCELVIHTSLPGFSTSKKTLKNKDKKFNESLAIFFDRDGTINEDVGYLTDVSEIKISDENLKGLKLISQLKYLNIIITNQSGVEKGYLTKYKLNKINENIVNQIESYGGRIDKVFFDISSDENPSKFRKPNNGMILKAIDEFNIVLKNSWLIGDKDTDVELAKKNNIKSIYIENKMYKYTSEFKYDYKVKNLLDAYKIIKQNLN